MLNNFFNWRVLLSVIAIGIVAGTIVYTSYLADTIEKEERKKMELWVEAKNTEIKAGDGDNLALTLAGFVSAKNKEIPIILTNENDSIIDALNLDSARIKSDTNYLKKNLSEFKSQNQPIVWTNPIDSTQIDKLYYGKSTLLKQLKWYPYIQLFIVSLFIIITLLSLQSRNKATQNQVWAGMAKETAHQLGTPLSSLQGWLEVLKSEENNNEIVTEIEKDIRRLDLISDRFGKIGSIPKFEDTDVLQRVEAMAEYMRKRASGKVLIEVHCGKYDRTTIPLSSQLFDWVIENLIKNALDALEGKGSIHIYIFEYEDKVIIDVADTGKGIPRNKWSSVFKPGFTTKKRGWGLGLSLTKRIVESYHRGKIYVKESESNKGTTFRIILPRRRE